MKDSPEKIFPLRRRMIEDMRMRNLSTCNRRGPATIPSALRGSRCIADGAERGDQRIEVLL